MRISNVGRIPGTDVAQPWGRQNSSVTPRLDKGANEPLESMA
jgi:hypothetical protein